MNYGMKVKVFFQNGERIVYRNVTEIQYRYGLMQNDLGNGKRVAFESDIHSAGVTWGLAGFGGRFMLHVIEFETSLETEKASDFQDSKIPYRNAIFEQIIDDIDNKFL